MNNWCSCSESPLVANENIVKYTIHDTDKNDNNLKESFFCEWNDIHMYNINTNEKWFTLRRYFCGTYVHSFFKPPGITIDV